MKREELKLEIWGACVFRIVVERSVFTGTSDGLSCLEQHVIEGENPVCGWSVVRNDALSKSRVVWECSPKWVVNSI